MLDENDVKRLLRCRERLQHATIRRAAGVVMLDSLLTLELQTFTADFAKVDELREVAPKLTECCKPIKRQRAWYFFTKYEFLGMILLAITFAGTVASIMFSTDVTLHYLSSIQFIVTAAICIYFVAKTRDRGLSKEADMLHDKIVEAIKTIDAVVRS